MKFKSFMSLVRNMGRICRFNIRRGLISANLRTSSSTPSKFFNLQVLLHPFEERFYLPPVVLSFYYLQRVYIQGICEEDEVLPDSGSR